ncbi:MAG: hypothetical protein KF899_04230 [Parvibaculum sp.]|nr:hypothetical protein [Parvibaculum sp.]
MVAIALVRLQLDTVLRLYALYWVDNPEDFATLVFSGRQIDRIAASDGSLMKDKYLIEKLKDKNPWIEDVYKNTSGLIHFSERHMHAAIRLPDDASGEMEFFLGATDPRYKLADYKEVIGAFFHCTSMIFHVADEWLVLPPLSDESEKQSHPFLATTGEKVTP